MDDAAPDRMFMVPVPVASGVLWLPVAHRAGHRTLSRRPATSLRPAARPPGRGSLRHDFRTLLGDRSGRPRQAVEIPLRADDGGPGPVLPAAVDTPALPQPEVGARSALLIVVRAAGGASGGGSDGGRDVGGRDVVLEDSERLRAVLADPDVGGYAVTLLAVRTASEIRSAVEGFLSERGAADQVLVHLAVPSRLDTRERLLLCGAEHVSGVTDPAAECLPAQWLADRLDACPARRQVLVLDVPHGFAWGLGPGTGDPARPLVAWDATRTRVVVTAGPPAGGLPAVGPAPGAPGAPGAGPSLTALLVHGLSTGEADADGDGLVTLDEAYTYIRSRAAAGPGPTPRRWVTGRQTLLLARNPHAGGSTGGGPVPTSDAAAALRPVSDAVVEPPLAPQAAPAPQPGPASDPTPNPTPNPAADPTPEPAAGHAPEPDPDLMRALRVARTLDPAQALAAVQGLDADQILEVAQALRLATPAPGPTVPAPRRRQLGDILLERGVLTPEQLGTALAAQQGHAGPRRPLGRIAVELGLAGEREVAGCLAQLLNLELVDLSRQVPDPNLVRLLPRAVAERTRMIVIDRTARGEPVVAASDPTNVVAFDDVRLYTRSPNLKICVALDTQITDQLNRVWSLESDTSGVAEIVEEAAGRARQDEPEQWRAAEDEDAPIVRLVTQILADGVRQRASDIHLEVQRDTLRVRYRVDGLLRDVMEAPRRVATSVISRVKIISGLDIAERRVPQDGRTRLTVEGVAIDARVSTLPSLHGEKVVIRLLTRGDAVPGLASLGFEPGQLALLTSALAAPQGLILITGPTGSGKTNTLYSAIAHIRSPELNIVTLEDPVEVQLPDITQVGVSERTGMTFSRGLRAILRQDPDVILVGEVRDGETAQLALKAAMTGHLVLSTLHTNSAVAALTRMVDMGAEPFVVASSLTLSVAQRLVRTPCQACAVPYRPDDVTLDLLGVRPEDLATATSRKGAGCPECGGSGYRGRSAVYEVLDVDAAMRQVLLKDPTEAAVAARAAEAGMVGLRASAVLAALKGRTTFEEALRVTSR